MSLRILPPLCALLLFVYVILYTENAFAQVADEGATVSVASIKAEAKQVFDEATKAVEEANRVKNEATQYGNDDRKRAKEKHEVAKQLGQDVDVAKNAIKKAQSGQLKTEAEYKSAMRLFFNAIEKTNKARSDAKRTYEGMLNFEKMNVSNVSFQDGFKSTLQSAKEQLEEAKALIQNVKAAPEKMKQAANSVEVALLEVNAIVAANKVHQVHETVKEYIDTINRFKKSTSKLQKELGESIIQESIDHKKKIESSKVLFDKALETEETEMRNLNETKEELEHSQKEVSALVNVFATDISLETAVQTHEKIKNVDTVSQTFGKTSSESFIKAQHALVSSILDHCKAIVTISSVEINGLVKVIKEHATLMAQEKDNSMKKVEFIQSIHNTAPEEAKQHVSPQLKLANESLNKIRQKCEEAEQLAHEAEKEAKNMYSIVSAEEGETSTQEAEARAMKFAQIAAASKVKEEQAKQAFDEVVTEAEKVEMAMHGTTAIVASAITVLSATRAREYATQAKEKQSEAHMNVESLRRAQKNAPSDLQTILSANVVQAEKLLNIIVENAEKSDHAANEAEVQKRISITISAEIQQQDGDLSDAKNLSEKCNATSTVAAAHREAARAALAQIVLESERIEKIVQSTTAVIASAATKPVGMLEREVHDGVSDNESYDNIGKEFPEIYTFEF